jgi:hypothetical protein
MSTIVFPRYGSPFLFEDDNEIDPEAHSPVDAPCRERLFLAARFTQFQATSREHRTAIPTHWVEARSHGGCRWRSSRKKSMRKRDPAYRPAPRKKRLPGDFFNLDARARSRKKMRKHEIAE